MHPLKYISVGVLLLMTITVSSGFPTTPVRHVTTTPRTTLYTPNKHFIQRPTYPPGSQELKPGWKTQEMPNPQSDLYACGRGGKRSFVCDPTNILSTYEADDIDAEIHQLCRSSPRCLCRDESNNEYSRVCTDIDGCTGIKIAVAVVPNIYNQYQRGSVGRAEARDWARELRKSQWSFGACEDNVVIVLSKNDRQVFTSTGVLARKVLSDACVDQYYKEVRDYLTVGDYGEGIKRMIEKFRKGIAGGKCGQSSGQASASSGLSTAAIVWIVIGSLMGVGLIVMVCLIIRTPSGGSSSSSSYFSSHHYSSGGGGWFSGGGGSSGGGGGGGDGGGGGSF